MDSALTFLASLDWVQIAWSVLCLAGLALFQWYFHHDDPIRFTEGTTPP